MLSPITPLNDPTLLKLVGYVADYLNQAWQQHLIVRHTEIYDAFAVPFDRYPLLKIYRRYSRNTINDEERTTEVSLAYCLLNAQITKTPAIANWININVIHALQKYRFEHPSLFEIDNNITCRYRTMIQLGEIVHQIEIDFSILNETAQACQDFSNPCC